MEDDARLREEMGDFVVEEGEDDDAEGNSDDDGDEDHDVKHNFIFF